ncbi:RnfABCDGE type electron transport complex subunit D [Proteiniclasticum sp. QWL-01]|uniref:RnfABCDGE type electron transport complex subunit D n=1 Tax=Proteiniclasticum sp. QWL-01 TaxID=3036945 RepID=UPI002410E316|nr:RnfABCDGE type electron transport complex subunit D [Proteiniclasticum sp. QWL-01]WFF73875.1 RnfABCDGE type electron transport complex subunit D [Proteiniclasticum sp. QWL-01]
MQITKYLTKQKMMRTVLWSLLPIYLFSIYLFGWRVLLVLAVSLVSAFAGELVIMRMINGDKAKVSEAALVTAALFTLTLPPTIPLWITVVGTLFGIIFGKAIFGGFGKNVFNPALVGRAFVYVSFPIQMTVNWQKPFSGFPGGFLHWAGTADLATSVTPMIDMEVNGLSTNPLNLFIGNISGSMGETSAILILLAAAYLIYTKTASWKIMASVAASGIVFTLLFGALGGPQGDPVFSILSGGFLFGTVFMATDPVSAPMKDTSKILYGILIGFVTMVIRSFSLFTEGMMFAILIANSFAPLIDLNVKNWEAKKKAKAAPPPFKEVK